MQKLEVDCLIVGAGIAGLWLLNKLAAKGFSVLLLEHEAIGSGQTIKSQGIIHGGTKYALKGKSQATIEIARMASIWHDCINGAGEIDLSSVNILSPHHYLWTRTRYTARLKNLISSKLLSSGSTIVKKNQTPAAFCHSGFYGSLLSMTETVFDVPSLIDVLAAPYRDQILLAKDATYHFTSDGVLSSVSLSDEVQVAPQHTFFCAAAGAEKVLKNVVNAPKMQRRPLHMVYLTKANLPEVFVHCVEKGVNPRVTITTHHNDEGDAVWYLGGELAESGITRTRDEQIAMAQKELALIMPWINLDGAVFETAMIDRCEGATKNNARPDLPLVKQLGNITVIWPTKLTFAPLAAQMAVKDLSILPHYPPPNVVGIKKAPLKAALWNN